MDDDHSHRSVRRINAIAIMLFFFGLSQIAGYLLNNNVLRAIGAASAVAPFPKVFSDVDGVETFALSFVLEYADAHGERHHLQITPEIYSMLKGPYNRRNVYGAALSYGPTPRFPPELFEAVFHYAFVDPGRIKNELGLPADAHGVRLMISSKTTGRPDKWRLPQANR